MPDEAPAGLEHACPFRDDACVIRGLEKEPERREEIHDGGEPPGPPCGEPAHVAASVPKGAARPTFARPLQQVARQIQTVDVEPGLREEVGMPSLPARDIEHTRPGG